MRKKNENQLVTSVIVAAIILLTTGIVQADLVSHWTFDSDSEAIAYDSEDDHDGTCHGTELTGGYFGNAYLFDFADYDGTDDSVNMDDVADFDFGADDSFSISARIKTSNSSDALPIVEKWYGPGYMFIVDSGKLNFYMDDLTNVDFVMSQATVTDNYWHYVVAVRDEDSNELRVYIDGDPNGTETADLGSLANAGDFTVGISSNTETCFDGKIDDVKIYDHALSDGDVAEMGK